MDEPRDQHIVERRRSSSGDWADSITTTPLPPAGSRSSCRATAVRVARQRSAQQQPFWYDTRPDFGTKSYAPSARWTGSSPSSSRSRSPALLQGHKYGPGRSPPCLFALIGCGSRMRPSEPTPTIDITRPRSATGRDRDGQLLKGVKATRCSTRLPGWPSACSTQVVGDHRTAADRGDSGHRYARLRKYSRGYKAGGFKSRHHLPARSWPTLHRRRAQQAFEVA